MMSRRNTSRAGFQGRGRGHGRAPRVISVGEGSRPAYHLVALDRRPGQASRCRREAGNHDRNRSITPAIIATLILVASVTAIRERRQRDQP